MLPKQPKGDSTLMPEEPVSQEGLPNTCRASTLVQEEPLVPEDLPLASTPEDIPNAQAGSTHPTTGDSKPGDQAEEDVPVIFFGNEGILLLNLFYPY